MAKRDRGRRPPPASAPEPKLVADEQQMNAAWLEEPQAPETRGEKKRKALQLERLGESLVTLPPAKLARVPMPDDLAAAVNEARRIKALGAHGGYRRQVQFIGRIMRTLDAQPIADALEAMRGEDAPSAAAFRAAERWRDRLIAEGDAALEELLRAKPGADPTRLRQLARQAQRERAAKKPPHAGRALFRELRALFGPASTPLD
jgi:ribosome-associated protein